MCDKVVGDKVVCQRWCVKAGAADEEEGGGGGGIQNQKQEPRTKMWAIITIL